MLMQHKAELLDNIHTWHPWWGSAHARGSKAWRWWAHAWWIPHAWGAHAGRTKHAWRGWTTWEAPVSSNKSLAVWFCLRLEKVKHSNQTK